MAEKLDRELQKLLVETNDLRRRTGQTFWHFFRTLVFWHDKGKGFSESLRLWAPGGAAVFRTLETVLRDMDEHVPDEELRSYTAEVFTRLADDLERGEHMRMSFLRWLESRFSQLTGLMQTSDAGVRIFDYEYARRVGHALELIKVDRAHEIPQRFRKLAEELVA